MRRPAVTLALSLSLSLAAGPSRAQAPVQPYVFPQSDTAVTYVTGGTAASQLMRVSAALGLQRVDAPGGGMAIVTDTVHGTMTVIDLAAHTYSVGPAPPGTADMRGRRAPGGYVAVGQAVVAGLPCGEWATHDPSGRPVTVCLTGDGVLLRVRAGNAVLAAASSVSHEALDPSLFAPAPGFSKVRR